MSFENQEIELKYLFPDLETPVGESVTTTVGEGVEFDVDTSELFTDGTFEPGYTIDISGNSILFTTVDASTGDPL
jgi:hypothetical protein